MRKRFRVGIIGTGHIAPTYIECINAKFPILEIAGIASRHIENALKMGEEYNIPAFTIDEIISLPYIEIILILTPAPSHYDLIKKALMAGKHVYTEKTMTETVAQAKEVCALAKELGLYIGSAPDTFLGACCQTAKKAIDNGDIGRVTSFTVAANRNNQVLLSLFSYLRAPGNGLCIDYGVYYMTQLVHLLGRVKKASAVVDTPVPEVTNVIDGHPEFGNVYHNPNDSQLCAVLQMESGVSGTFMLNADSVLADQAVFYIYGTKGILILECANDFDAKVYLLKDSLDYFHPFTPQPLPLVNEYQDESRGIGLADMAQAILEGREAAASGKLATDVLEALTTILRSGKSGKTECTEEEDCYTHPYIKGISHVCLNAKHMDEMLEFYCGKLEFHEKNMLTYKAFYDLIDHDQDPTAPKHLLPILAAKKDEPWAINLEFGSGQYLEIFYPTGDKVELEHRDRYFGYDHFALETDDIYKAYDWVRSKGILPFRSVHRGADGIYSFWIEDPDGNQMEFVQNGLPCRE